MFGVDGRSSFVRGMGGGVTKHDFLASAIPREMLRQEQQKTREWQTRVEWLEEQFAQLRAGSTGNANQVIYFLLFTVHSMIFS